MIGDILAIAGMLGACAASALFAKIKYQPAIDEEIDKVMLFCKH